MCFTIYIATNEVMPTILYDESSRTLNTEDITEDEETLKNIFSLPNIKFVGSDQGCGCGFRHALLDGNNWLTVLDEDQTNFDNSNHRNLVDFIVNNNITEKKIEILTCWEGDHNEPLKSFETIQIQDLLKEDFYFKERALYTVRL